MVNARTLILMAMATHTPIMAEARLIHTNDGMSGRRNGGRPMFKQNRRAQMKKAA